MVFNGRKLIIGIILLLAIVLSVMALNQIVTGPELKSDEVSASLSIDTNKNRTPAAGSYFSEHRMVRERNRSRQIELLEKIVNNEKIDNQSKTKAARELISLTEISELERLAEETVKAIGYSDCVVLLRDNAALAVVAADELDQNKEKLLADHLAEILKLKPENVTVMARPAAVQR